MRDLKQREGWGVGAVLLLGLLLRLVNLGGRTLWYDEAFAVLYAEKPLAQMIYGTVAQAGGAAADVHPLLYYFTLHYWMAFFGQSEVAVRLLSVLLGTATIGLSYLLARRLFGGRVGLAAALVTAVSPFHIYYSQETRMYALLGFAGLLTAWLFARAWSADGWRSWLPVGVAGALTLYAHNLGFLNLAALDLWTLWAWFRPGGRPWRHLRGLVVAHALMLLLFFPWLTLVPSQFGKIQQAYWVQRPGPVKIVQTVAFFHFNLPLQPWLMPVAIVLSFMLLVIVLFECWGAGAGGKGREAGSLLSLKMGEEASLPLFLFLVPPVALFLISQIRPVYIVRGLLPSALAYYLLFAAVFVRGGVPRAIRLGLLASAAVVVALALPFHYTYARFPRPPFDEVVIYLRENYQPGDAIVHDNKLTFFPCHYYDRELPQAFMADPPGSGSDTLALPTQQALGLLASRTMEEATAGSQRVWFVIFQRAFAEYQELGYPQPPHKAWLEARFRPVTVKSFNDLDVYLYEGKR